MGKDRSGFGGFIRNLFHRTQDQTQTAEMGAAQEQVADKEEAQKEQIQNVRPDLIVIERGALWEIWNQWVRDDTPPVLSMSSQDTELPFDRQALLKERLRLMVSLERDAKIRMDKLKREDEKFPPECKIYLSSDKMAAWAFVFPPTDLDANFSFDQIGKEMGAKGISNGIDSSAITYLFQERAYYQLIPIAYGTPAVPGEPGRIIDHYPREVQLEVKVDENGVADYRALSYVQLINQGDVICDIVPPKEGVAGICVDGTVLKPQPVPAIKVPSGRNTMLSEDGLHLLASLDGHLQFSNQAFHVRPVLEIKADVDYTTGNIDFNGDVHIAGDVRENFSVRATGTITIDGLVEGAMIQAGGDLVVASGVLGNYKAVLKSWGCIRVKYLENCVAYAGKGVFADCIMASQVFSDDSVQVTSGRGTIIGGSITAAYEVKARLIGSQAGRKTTIKLGTMPFAEEDLRSNQAELQAVRKEIHDLDRDLKGLVENQGISGSNEKLAKAQLKKSVLALKEMQLVKRREKLEPMTPDLARCRLEADVIYPITQVSMGVDYISIGTISSHCRIKYDVTLGEIKMI